LRDYVRALRDVEASSSTAADEEGVKDEAEGSGENISKS